nr:putative sulfate exporter family transporter [Ferruginibacter sp. HRS2-29]
MIFIVLVVLCLTPWITPPMALLLGLMVAQFIGHPFLHLNQKATSRLLQFSVIGLGFGMNVKSALQAGKEGFLFAVASILGTLILGYFLGKLLKVEQKTSLLISSGTAICGGSAIAALSPILEAEENQISVALGTIFILNAVALFIFPVIGHALNLTEHQFGLWCAIAIHDTSSVVGAAGKYGPQALETATTVKLSRALWIIPIAIGASILLKNDAKKIKIPYFIGLFILAMLLNSYVPAITKISFYITGIAKTGLTLTLFLIGAGLSRKVLTSVGLKPLLQGILLWLVISSGALYAIRSFAG